MNTLTLYPSVDIVKRKALISRSAIQITQGKTIKKEMMGDPLDIAFLYQDAGAKWIHIVDLDAAAKRGNNKDIVLDIIQKLDVNIQVCGGISDETTLKEFIMAGCARVNIGSAALENPDWCDSLFSRYGERVAIALDVKTSSSGYQLATRGWNHFSDDLWAVLARLDKQKCHRYVVTDVEKAGMMTHPNFNLLKLIIEKTCKPVIAGGGLSNLADIKSLSEIGVEGAILGQVLHTKNMSYSQAMMEAGV